MLQRLLCALLSWPVLATMAHAETVVCPDLSQAVLVGTCPSEEELQFTFNGYCSDNARIYNWQEEQVCTDYQLYRRLKNVALWEAGNGDFHAYLSCELPPELIRKAAARKVEVVRQGKLTRVVCSYANDVAFAYRTKARCKVEGSGDCASDPAACKVSCD